MKKVCTFNIYKVIALFLVVCFFLLMILGYSAGIKVLAQDAGFNIVQVTDGNVETFRLNNIFALKATSTKTKTNINPLDTFSLEHPKGFNVEMAQESNYVVYQKQTLAADSDSWSDSEGYLTIYTTAYHRGYTPTGNARYQITAEIDFHKTFIMRNEEQLILNHSAAGVFDSTGSEWGTMSYHASLHNHSAFVNPPIDKEEDVTLNITPDYSQASGVCFKFEWPEDLRQFNNAGGALKVDIRNVYTDWYLTANYYVIATNDTNVAVSYIHNEKITGGALSVSFGAYGISANINIDGTNTPYYARPILIYNI